jgi:FKBP-type peptidyl-prolyl cis-trans isomerase
LHRSNVTNNPSLTLLASLVASFARSSPQQFDSSRDRGKPFKFRLCSEQVIEGLDEGVSSLSIGERAQITIPASKAYSSRGFPGLVPPNTDLFFDIELITFN